MYLGIDLGTSGVKLVLLEDNASESGMLQSRWHRFRALYPSLAPHFEGSCEA